MRWVFALLGLLLASAAYAQQPAQQQQQENPCRYGDDLDRLSCMLGQANTLAIHLQPQLRTLIGAMTELRGANAWWVDCITKPECVTWSNTKGP